MQRKRQQFARNIASESRRDTCKFVEEKKQEGDIRRNKKLSNAGIQKKVLTSPQKCTRRGGMYRAHQLANINIVKTMNL